MTTVSILYVEDCADLREAIGMLLEGDGREVVACADAESAIATLAARDFDVLVTDVSLPGMSGTDLARRLLAREPDRWVVLCSGYDFNDELDRLGPNVRSIAKSCEPEALDALMDEISAAVRAGK